MLGQFTLIGWIYRYSIESESIVKLIKVGIEVSQN